MIHSRFDRALLGQNSLKIFLIHFVFEILTVTKYYSNKTIIEAFVQHKIDKDPLIQRGTVPKPSKCHNANPVSTF